MPLDFLAATKDGVVIMDAESVKQAPDDDELDYMDGITSDDRQVKVLATLPSPPNAFGHGWSADGNLLGSVCDDGIRVYDATKGYEMLLELPKVAPDVGGRMGGVRNLRFSPKNNFLVTYEKWDPQFPENVHVWDIRDPTETKEDRRLYSTTLRGYTSGALPVENIKWTEDERAVLELVPGEGVLIRSSDFGGVGQDEDEDSIKRIPEKSASNFVVSTKPQKDSYYVACYMPEAGMVARVAVYHLESPTKPTVEVHLPAKVKDARILFNCEGSELLALANSDVDETGSSYFGTTYLYWISAEGKTKPFQLFGAKDGLVQDLCWAPNKNEFAVIVGMLPAEIALYDGKNGKLLSKLGQSKRNTLKWNPFGRFLAVGGFGTLPGDMEFFDRSCEETVCSLRAALTVDCAWAPDGKQFLACTVAPRMNEGNQLSVYRYTGEMAFQILFKPKFVEARHEDTGAGARTKTQALLFAASWRPRPDDFEDEPATPRPAGAPKRKKGLPDDNASAVAAGAASAAYRPKAAGGYGGGGGSLISAMMRGEISAPEASKESRTEGGWEVKETKPLEEWEIRKMQREAKKEQERKEQEAKEAEKQLLRDIEQGQKDGKKRLKELRKKLEELEVLKEKEWDELTEEDEAEIEKEMDIRAEIVELERKVGGG